LYPGEVHAVMGENGAGKSTLIKLITGVYSRDAGSILLDEKPIDPHSPYEAQALGISTVYQEINLIPTMSVAENLFLGRQPMRGRELISVMEEGGAKKRGAGADADSFLQVQGMGRKGMLEPLDLSVAKGEIVGLAGLLGSGRTETARLIFGIDRSDTGNVYV